MTDETSQAKRAWHDSVYDFREYARGTMFLQQEKAFLPSFVK